MSEKEDVVFLLKSLFPYRYPTGISYMQCSLYAVLERGWCGGFQAGLAVREVSGWDRTRAWGSKAAPKHEVPSLPQEAQPMVHSPLSYCWSPQDECLQEFPVCSSVREK